MWSISAKSHCCVVGIISSETVLLNSTAGGGDIIFLWFSSNSQRWFQMLIDLPSPTLHTASLSMISLAFKMLCQAYEPLFLGFASRIVPFGKNLALNTLWNCEEGSCNSCQTCLPRRASLNFRSSRNPIPPDLFGWHRVFHRSQLTLLWFGS